MFVVWALVVWTSSPRLEKSITESPRPYAVSLAVVFGELITNVDGTVKVLALLSKAAVIAWVSSVLTSRLRSEKVSV